MRQRKWQRCELALKMLEFKFLRALVAKVLIGVNNVRIQVFKGAVHITICCSLISEGKT